MKGLLLKDYYTLLKQLRFYLIFLLFIIFYYIFIKIGIGNVEE